MAADFAADFVNNLPQDNPNGPWTYLGTDGTSGSLVPTNGTNPNTFGVGAGWADINGVPSYARGGAFGFPNASSAMAGHGPNQIVWTAPASVDLGGVEISGLFTQAPFEPTRQMQLRIFKNDFAEPLITVAADFAIQNTVLQLPDTIVSMEAGDTLTIIIDGGGPQGNGVATFAAWNVIITEYQLPGDYNLDGTVDAADYSVWRDHLGSTGIPGMVPGDGTTTGNLNGLPDGIVDQSDYDLWQQHFGDSFDPGGEPLVYHPSAIVVQPSGVTLPDGLPLDVSSSQTQGLQEAFNYSAEHGWDVFVLPGTYNLSAHLDVEELQLRTFRFEDVTLNFSSAVTDFGIRFDSTMLTNLYWKGGAINAPQATHGVIFQPRTPHPLDGMLYGTIGVVDSYFHFNVDITAATHRVTMNTQQATINDLTFFFRGVTRQQINYVGSGFAAYNIFEPERADAPIPFDLFNPAGRVTVSALTTNLQTGAPGTVFLPDGSILDIAGTQTFGLQEAFDYAAVHDLDVLVFGRGVRNIAPTVDLGSYNLNTPLRVVDLTNRTYRLYGGTLNFPITGDTLQLGDIVNSSFEFSGQVVSPNANNAVVIRPDAAGVVNSSVRVQAVVGSNGTGDTAVRLDPGLANIQNNTLYFHEVNTGYYGIKVMNPSLTTDFSGNLIRSLHTHATGYIGLQLGETAINSNRIFANDIELRTNTDGVSAYAALQVWADANDINIYAGNSGLTYGARFESSSNDNVTAIGYLQALTPVVNVGTNNTFTIAASGAGAGDGGASLESENFPTPQHYAKSSAAGSVRPFDSDVARFQPIDTDTLLTVAVSSYRLTERPISPDVISAKRRLAFDTVFAEDGIVSFSNKGLARELGNGLHSLEYLTDVLSVDLCLLDHPPEQKN